MVCFGTDSDSRIKEALRKQFANMANSFYQKLRELSAEVSAIDGKLEVHLLVY
jgi:hypothetical protein